MWSYLSQDANTLGCAKSISLTGINECLVFFKTYSFRCKKSTHALFGKYTICNHSHEEYFPLLLLWRKVAFLVIFSAQEDFTHWPQSQIIITAQHRLSMLLCLYSVWSYLKMLSTVGFVIRCLFDAHEIHVVMNIVKPQNAQDISPWVTIGVKQTRVRKMSLEFAKDNMLVWFCYLCYLSQEGN